MKFANKTIIITGASRGIGRALAIKLAQEKANLVLAARNEADLNITAQKCLKAGGKPIVVPTDIIDPQACQKLIKASLTAFGAIDCLVNNAGMSMWTRFDEIEDLTLFNKIMQVNYLGAVYCTHYALPHLKKSAGLLVAISSLTGKTGVPTRSGYAASKHALQGFCDSLRIELQDAGVDVLVVSPGFVATEIRQNNVIGGDGKPISTTLNNEQKTAMSVELCADLILKAMQQRKRELVMTLKGKLGLWLKLFAPKLVDAIATKAVSSQKCDR
ncbi:SDR family oxidoreductase [Waterburya agarophytonicola K14]|uniref:SDR family oxidoreductase n=1 Tax=Waterburya agarophytonicola KI4 TaxID=2874699 RepID=A0A964BSG9_9CYAN|nr:SDR family oxidoreductase [Waterburya agarophytonicola]MCC0177668.1 SDR family oxidoreductase [Waterburya agarophytonicola KI4]